MRKVLLLLALAASSLVVIVGPGVAASDTHCIGALAPGVYDNVVVPEGETCTMMDSTVLGNVKALEDSELLVDGSIVDGNITLLRESHSNVFRTEVGGSVHGDLARFVGVFDTTVAGNVEVVGPGRPVLDRLVDRGVNIQGVNLPNGNLTVMKMTGSLSIPGNNVVGHNLQVTDNFIPEGDPFLGESGGTLGVAANEVGQNLQVYNNTGGGPKSVGGNTVHESLQCFDNDPPFVGTGNVAREAQGQCSAAPLPPSAAPPTGGGGVEV